MTPRHRQVALLLLSFLALLLPRDGRAQTIPPFVAYHAATAAGHQSQWNTLRPQGYRLITLSVYGDPSDERYAAVWVKRSGPTQAAIHHATAAQLTDFYNTVVPQGYRPIIVTVTGPPASAVFAAVFEKSTVAGWSLEWNLISGADTLTNSIEYKMKQARANGYIPLSLSRYGSGGTDTRYAVIFVYNPTNVAWNYNTGPFATDYQQYFNANTSMFYRPSCIGVNNGQYYSSVFRDDRIGPYYAVHDLTSQEYQDAFILRTGQGYYPILVEGAGAGSGARFAAVFAKQETPIARVWKITGLVPTGISAADSAKFDNIMKLHMQRHGVRAGQLSFSKYGKMIYSRAFTWAEPDYPITQTNSPMRLASNSKAFTEAAIYNLAKSHAGLLGSNPFALLGITEKALDSQTVSQYIDDITVQHLLDHKGGWDDQWSGFDPVFHPRDIANALGITTALKPFDMARFMYGEPLQWIPGAHEQYSNFGYVLLGLIVEKLSGKTYEDYVQENVLVPIGVSNVWQARTAKANRLPNEGYYDDPKIGLTALNPTLDVLVPQTYGGAYLTEAMPGGGGLAATATSLTQFIWNYAVWGYGLRNPGAARTGSMQGTSSLAVSRDDGADYALILNTRYWKAGYDDPVGDMRSDISTALTGIKPRVESITVTPAMIPGGATGLAMITLAFVAPEGGADVSLSSTNTAVATVPASVHVLAGQNTAFFNITTYPQAANATTTLRTTYNGVLKTKVLTVTPIQIASLTLAPSLVYGGTKSTGTITVYGKAAVDTTISVTSASSAAHPVTPVIIPAGESTVTFDINTDPVTANTTGAITASYNGFSRSANLTVKPPVLSTLTLSPNPVHGGSAVVGKVSMSGPVAVNTVIQLTNTNSKARLPNGTNSDTITVPAGSKTAGFTIATQGTLVIVKGTVSATLGAVTKSVTLTVSP